MSLKKQMITHWGRLRRRRALDRVRHFPSCLGAGMRFQGKISGVDHGVVYGEIEGDGEFQGCVVVATGAHWLGDIVGGYVVVAGHVEGNISAQSSIELAATAVVTGDLNCPRVAIAEGALHTGKILSPRKTHTLRFVERRSSMRQSHPVPVQALPRRG